MVEGQKKTPPQDMQRKERMEMGNGLAKARDKWIFKYQSNSTAINTCINAYTYFFTWRSVPTELDLLKTNRDPTECE